VDEINSGLECSGVDKIKIENSMSDQIPISSPEETLTSTTEEEERKKSITFPVSPSILQEMKQNSLQENNEEHVLQNEKITTRLSSRSYIEWDGDEGTMIKTVKNTERMSRDVVGGHSITNRCTSTSRDNHAIDKQTDDNKKTNLVSDSISESDVVSDDLEKKEKNVTSESRTLGHATQINSLPCMKIPTVNISSSYALDQINHNELSTKRHQDTSRSPRKKRNEGYKDENSVEIHQQRKRQNYITGNQQVAPVSFEMFSCRLVLPIPKQHAYGKLEMYCTIA
jgi:hypothetical protein